MLLLSLLLTSLWLTSAAAFELGFELSSGYDDNPRQEKKSKGALFTQTELDLNWTLPFKFIPATTISLSGFAAYQCYSGLNDNWQLGGGLTSATKTAKIPGIWYFFSDAACYRNPLISDNDYDSLSIGTNFTWFTGPRSNLNLETSLDWETYCDSVTDNRQSHKKPHNSIYNKKTTRQSKHHNFGDRNDRLMTASLKSFYAFSPNFESTETIFWRYRHSSIDAECRQAYGLNLDLNWRPIPTVEVSWQLGSERLPYKYRYKKQLRTEKLYNLGILIAWYIHDFTLQSSWSWNKRDSIVNEDNYQQNLWQIRLKYLY